MVGPRFGVRWPNAVSRIGRSRGTGSSAAQLRRSPVQDPSLRGPARTGPAVTLPGHDGTDRSLLRPGARKAGPVRRARRRPCRCGEGSGQRRRGVDGNGDGNGERPCGPIPVRQWGRRPGPGQGALGCRCRLNAPVSPEDSGRELLAGRAGLRATVRGPAVRRGPSCSGRGRRGRRSGLLAVVRTPGGDSDLTYRLPIVPTACRPCASPCRRGAGGGSPETESRRGAGIWRRITWSAYSGNRVAGHTIGTPPLLHLVPGTARRRGPENFTSASRAIGSRATTGAAISVRLRRSLRESVHRGITASDA